MKRLYAFLIGCWIVAASGCNSEPPKKSYYFLNSVTALRETLPRISKKHIEELRVARIDLSNEDLAIIAEFKNLESLHLQVCEIDDADLTYIAKLRNLRALELSAPDITDAGLAHLAKLQNLTELRLSAKGITDAGLVHLGKLEKLTRFELSANGITDASFVHLANLRNLEWLGLRCDRVTGSGFHFLPKGLPLRHLDCEGPMDDEAMKYVARFEGLQELWLSGTPVTDAGWMQVSRNYWLINVNAPREVTEEGLLAFRKTLLEGRRQARESGVVVPPDDTLYIFSRFCRNRELTGDTPEHGYSQRLDALWATREKR